MLDPLRLPRALASAPNIDWAAYLYLLPAGFLLTLFGLWPIVFGFWISLWRWGITPERFVGIQNYLRILGNELVTTDAAGRPAAGEIGQSLVVTLYYAVGTVPLSVALAFVVAFLLFEGTPLRKRDAAPVTEMFGSVNTMFKSTPDQQLASWIFMAEMASTDTQSRLGADAGYFPSTRSSTSTSALQAAFSQVPQFKVAVDQIAPYMQLLPQSAALDQIRNRIATDVVTQVLLKKISPEDAARQLKMQGDQALKQAAS